MYCSMRKLHKIVDLNAGDSDALLSHCEFVKPGDFHCDYVFVDQLGDNDEKYDIAVTDLLRFVEKLSISGKNYAFSANASFNPKTKVQKYLRSRELSGVVDGKVYLDHYQEINSQSSLHVTGLEISEITEETYLSFRSITNSFLLTKTGTLPQQSDIVKSLLIESIARSGDYINFDYAKLVETFVDQNSVLSKFWGLGETDIGLLVFSKSRSPLSLNVQQNCEAWCNDDNIQII